MTHKSSISMRDVLNEVGKEAEPTGMSGKESRGQGRRMTREMAKNVEQLVILLRENVNDQRK